VSELPLALAAGMLAAVNPCGFALLPAYLSLLVVGDDQPGRPTAALRAIVLTAAMTVGFAGLFGVFGLLLGGLADTVMPRLPWFSVGFGALLVALGGWLAAGRTAPTFGMRLRRGPAVTRSVPSMVLFGAAYAVASLGCTIGPFLAVVVSSLQAGATLTGVALYLAYAAGMGLVVGTAALAVAFASASVLGRLRRLASAASRAGGVLLVIAGGYVAYYGWYEVRLLRGEIADDPVTRVGEQIQQWAAGALDRAGAPALAAVFGALLALTALAGWRARARTVG
jgi:cytochrome c-type biogenesis protein